MRLGHLRVRLRNSLLLALFLHLPIFQIAAAQTASPPNSVSDAVSSKFICPIGARDSGQGPSPGVVIRWCEIEQNGRLLYHGPVWRWYRSGKLEGKGYYINGSAEGVWPSYYENGHMSSLGSFAEGRKIGLWKYWDNGGRLRTEVSYSENGNSRTDYYASGQKKDVGVVTRSGKIGKWIYWDQSGQEKASCDFGNGAFSVSSRGCQIISNELDPKGYSLPIAVGSINPDGISFVSVGTQVFKFRVPQGWVADVTAGRQEGVPLVFYPKGKAWRDSGANMYVRVLFKGGRSFDQIVDDDKQDFEQNVEEYREESGKDGHLSRDLPYRLKSITYKPLIETDLPFSIVASNQVFEQLAYIDGSKEIVLLLVLTTDSNQNLDQSVPPFQAILHSLH